MSGFGTTKKRHSPSRLGVTNWEELPEWVRGSLEAARHAPSAINRQPWGFSADETSIMVYVRTRGGDHGFSKRFDCGIAMLHVEIAALHFGIKGNGNSSATPRLHVFTELAEEAFNNKRKCKIWFLKKLKTGAN